MPLDPIDPQHFSMKPEQRQADRMAATARELGRLNRQSFNQVIRQRQVAQVTTEVSTSSTSLVDLGGPSISVSVASGRFVAIYVECDVRCVSGGGAWVSLYEPTDLPGGSDVIFTTQTTYATYRSAAGTSNNTGLGTWLIVRASAGQRTYSLRHKTNADTGFYRNRYLAVEVF